MRRTEIMQIPTMKIKNPAMIWPALLEPDAANTSGATVKVVWTPPVVDSGAGGVVDEESITVVDVVELAVTSSVSLIPAAACPEIVQMMS